MAFGAVGAQLAAQCILIVLFFVTFFLFFYLSYSSYLFLPPLISFSLFLSLIPLKVYSQREEDLFIHRH